ncbi:MAG: IS1380 family transposase [Arenicellales bacterium]|nr:IS1380 family transposase [Arenicellales bacterium]
MRLRRSDLKSRVNANLALRFQSKGLTSFAGIELFRQYISMIELPQLIRNRLGPLFRGRDFSIVSMVMLLLNLIVGGGRRIHHLGYMRDDPVVLRFAGLTRLPSTRTVGRWLVEFDEPRLSALRSVNSRLVADTIRGSGLKTLTVDVDGTVVSTGLQVSGAARGFNPHNRKRPSYYPISAYGAELGNILRLENRAGNIHDGKASLGFLTRVFDQLRDETEAGLKLRFRMDGAFFLEEILELMEFEQAEFAIKVPFWRYLNLQDRIAVRQRWKPVNKDVSCFETGLEMKRWGQHLRAIIYRKRVHHKSRKNYQLDLFDPNTGHWEYSAVATNMRLSGPVLWAFMSGRSAHEKAYGELKTGFAFNSIPSQQEQANSAWQHFSVLAFNLTRAFQAATTAPARPSNEKRTTLYRFAAIHTLRYKLLNRAGVIVSPKGRATLDLGPAPMVKNIFEKVRQKLDLAA